MSFLFQIERSDRKGRRKTSFQAGKTKRSFGVCLDKPVACLPKLRSRFWGFVTTNPLLAFQNYFQHEQSEFLNCAAIFTQINLRDHADLLHGIPTLKKWYVSAHLLFLFAQNTNFLKWCISAHLLFCFRTKHQLEK